MINMNVGNYSLAFARCEISQKALLIGKLFFPISWSFHSLDASGNLGQSSSECNQLPKMNAVKWEVTELWLGAVIGINLRWSFSSKFNHGFGMYSRGCPQPGRDDVKCKFQKYQGLNDSWYITVPTSGDPWPQKLHLLNRVKWKYSWWVGRKKEKLRILGKKNKANFETLGRKGDNNGDC